MMFGSFSGLVLNPIVGQNSDLKNKMSESNDE